MAKKIDILKHSLVPKHRILNNEEREALLNKYNIHPTQLPFIKLKDPVITVLNAKESDVIEIERPDKSSFYRLVVK